MTAVSAALKLVLAALLLIASLPAASAASPSHWSPPQHLTWFWELQGTIDNSHPAAAYDIDGFDNSAAEVSALHAGGARAICYIDVGTCEAPYVRRRLVLGSKHFHIPGARAALVEIRLSRTALRRLAGTRAVRVAVEVTARDDAGRRAGSHRAVTLVRRK